MVEGETNGGETMKEVIIDGVVYVPKEDDKNTGNLNSGNWNSGRWNSGRWNSGDRNSGRWNSGRWNSGDRNSGDRNSGDRNSGNWNSGKWNTGCFNTDEPTARMFNKECDETMTELVNRDAFPDWIYGIRLTEWIPVDEMTTKEKKAHPEHKTINGYLKTNVLKKEYKRCFKEAEKEDVGKTLALPNFDYKIFKEITGITKTDFKKKLGE